jgi:putative ATP-dependent endonuclease of the OLD family
MREFDNFSVRIKNFKCFGNEEQGFDTIKPINIIIGRNNSGKSSLLDLIDSLVKGFNFTTELWHAGQEPMVIGGSLLHEDELKQVFQQNTSGGNIPGPNHWVFGSQLIGEKIFWQLNNQSNRDLFVRLGDINDSSPLDGIKNKSHYLQRLAALKNNPFSDKEFRRISAERNIIPDLDNSTVLTLSKNGEGATNIIQNFINKANLSSDLVEETLLEEINKISKYRTKIVEIGESHPH